MWRQARVVHRWSTHLRLPAPPEFRRVGNQTSVLLADGFAATPPPGGLTFLQLVDEVRLHSHWTIPQLVHRLASKLCHPPLQGAELDLLKRMVTLTALYGVHFVDDFRQCAEAAPLIPGSHGHRIIAPICRQLIEHAQRPLPGGVQTASSAADLETITLMSEPELISDDEKLNDDPYL